MASAEQLKAVLRSHLDGDNDRFISVAMQVAAHEARLSHGKPATDLRDIIDDAKRCRETIRDTLRRRLKSLLDRDLVERAGLNYGIPMLNSTTWRELPWL